MALKNPERYNFYKSENVLKKGKKKFIKYIDDIIELEGINGVLTTLKSSGLSVNLFNSSKHKRLFEATIAHITSRCTTEDLEKIKDLKKDIVCFEQVFEKYDQIRDEYFNKYESIEDEYKVVSYLIALEIFLKSLTDKSNGEKLNELVALPFKRDHKTDIALFDSAIESTGMILKYFMYKKYDFGGIKRNISPKILNASLRHIVFSEFWYELNDVLEYWKYSDVAVTKEVDGKISFQIDDTKFEKNNLVSNERFNNLRQGWQMSQVGDRLNEYRRGDISQDDIVSESASYLNYLFSTLYFGSPLLDEKVNEIELREWIRAYQLLIDESKKFLKRSKNLNVYNLHKISISKTFYGWKKFFQRNGFSKEAS